MSILKKFTGDFRRLLLATLFFGATAGVISSTLNNYLNDVHGFGAGQRGWLELPREMPGFFIIFVVGALLTYMRESRMAAVAMLFTGAGMLGLGFLTPSTALLVMWVVIWSMGDHIIFAVEGPLGLKLARKGGEGRRLGQLGGARNLGVILGVSAVWLLAKLMGDRYDLFYVFGGLCAAIAGFFYFRLQLGHQDPPSRRLIYRREYHLFYAISALFGIRKQIFLVFGSWVLVDLHNVPVATIALLYFIASLLGVVLRPLLGDVIDWLGERKVLVTDEVMLLVVCLIYAFVDNIMVLYGAYILDHILFALRVARTTYLKKIAVEQSDITPTISLGITIDHTVAMTLPILSGFLWENYGHQWVFILAGAIALVGMVVCMQIKVPEPTPEPEGQAT
nr:MFS transporter [Candidatus Krumholzibacteria bacterium]